MLVVQYVSNQKGSFIVTALLLSMALLITGLGLIKYVSFNRTQTTKTLKSSSEETTLTNIHQLLAKEISGGHSTLSTSSGKDLQTTMYNFFYTNVFGFDKENIKAADSEKSFTWWDAESLDKDDSLDPPEPDHTLSLRYKSGENSEIYLPSVGGRTLNLKTMLVSSPYNFFQCALHPACNVESTGRPASPWSKYFFEHSINGKEDFRILDVNDPYDFNSFPKTVLVQTVGTYLADDELTNLAADPTLQTSTNLYTALVLQEEFIIDKESYSDFALIVDFSKLVIPNDLIVIGKAYIPNLNTSATKLDNITFVGPSSNRIGQLLTHNTSDNVIPDLDGGKYYPTAHKRINSLASHRWNASGHSTRPILYDLKRTAEDGTVWEFGTLDAVFYHARPSRRASSPYNNIFPKSGPSDPIDENNLESQYVNYSFGYFSASEDGSTEYSIRKANGIYVADASTELNSTPALIPTISAFTQEQEGYSHRQCVGGAGCKIGQVASYFASLSPSTTGDGDLSFKVFETIGVKTGGSDIFGEKNLVIKLTCNQTSTEPLNTASMAEKSGQQERDEFFKLLARNTHCVQLDGGIGKDSKAALTLSSNYQIPIKFTKAEHTSEDILNLLKPPTANPAAPWGHYIVHDNELSYNDADIDKCSNPKTCDNIWEGPNGGKIFDKLYLPESILYYTADNHYSLKKNNEGDFNNLDKAGIEASAYSPQFGFFPEAGFSASPFQEYYYMKPWMIDNVEYAGNSRDFIPTIRLKYDDGSTDAQCLYSSLSGWESIDSNDGGGGEDGVGIPTEFTDDFKDNCRDMKRFIEKGLFPPSDSSQPNSYPYARKALFRGIKQIMRRKVEKSLGKGTMKFGDTNSLYAPLSSKFNWIEQENNPVIPLQLSRIGLGGNYSGAKFLRIFAHESALRQVNVESFGAVYDEGPYTLLVEGDLTIDQPIHSYDRSIRLGIMVTGNVTIKATAGNCTQINQNAKNRRLDAFIMAGGNITFEAITIDDEECDDARDMIDNGEDADARFLISGGLAAYGTINFGSNDIIIENDRNQGSFIRPPGFGDTGVYPIIRSSSRMMRFSLLDSESPALKFLQGTEPIDRRDMESDR